MSDYIKREDAIKIINSGISIDTYADKRYVNGLFRAIRPADVAPVRHGHWDVREPMPMHDIKGNLSWGNWYVCTGCGFATTAIEGHITQYKYCPSCGARMDAKE